MDLSDFKVKDLVLYDNKEYKIIAFGPRNELKPLLGVNLIGNIALLTRPDGMDCIWAFEWELEKVNCPKEVK